MRRLILACALFGCSSHVEPEPPGANLIFGHTGAVSPRDSVWLALPRARGDADVRIYRGGIAVAHHSVEFGGDSVFEVRVGDRDQIGRYRRMSR